MPRIDDSVSRIDTRDFASLRNLRFGVAAAGSVVRESILYDARASSATPARPLGLCGHAVQMTPRYSQGEFYGLKLDDVS